jgi:hypothetical protein
MRRFAPALLAALLLLLPTPLLAVTATTAGVVLHAALPIGVVFVIYAAILRDPA